MANITYRQVNDYMIPNLRLSPEESAIRLGKWGMMYKDYLLKHKKTQFTIMLAEGTLWQHLSQIDQQANEMSDTLVKQMMKIEGVSEELKEENQMEWVRRMNSVQERASEIVCEELLYT